MEVVDFFLKPQRFRRSGAKIPRGVLLCGPPGVFHPCRYATFGSRHRVHNFRREETRSPTTDMGKCLSGCLTDTLLHASRTIPYDRLQTTGRTQLSWCRHWKDAAGSCCGWRGWGGISVPQCI